LDGTIAMPYPAWASATSADGAPLSSSTRGRRRAIWQAASNHSREAKPIARQEAGEQGLHRGLYGAARAAEAAGDRRKAAAYFEKLVALSGKAETTRPELARAKAFLGQR
jgi:uncharacterized protein HemY